MTHFQRHWLFVNMPFTKEHKILIKNLFELKGYNTGWSTVVPEVADDAASALILLTNWYYTKWPVEK